jgi:ABC-type sugar transport system ATPase subunit
MNFFEGAIVLENGEMLFREGRLENARATGAAASKIAKEGEADEPVVMTGELTLPENGFTLPVPERFRDRLAGKVGSHVVLGVRPEHIHMAKTADTLASLPVKVNVIEPLGKEMDVYLKTALHDHVVARVEARHSVKPGSDATAYIDLSKAHFFEPGETGMNLTRETTSPTDASSESSHAVA